MGKKEKLIEKMRSNPKSFTYTEAESLLGILNYHRMNKGKTSGSRVMYINREKNIKISLHKPHPQKELKEYQVKQLIDHLEKEGLI